MSFHSQTIVRQYGFKTTWEIIEQLLDDIPFTTKPEVVEGMPDVKWSLRCQKNRFAEFSIALESKYRIVSSFKCKLLYHNMSSEMKKSITIGKSYIRLLFIGEQDFQYHIKKGKVAFELEASFSYTEKLFNDFNVCDATEWGLRLKKSNSTDFDILVDGQSIGIHKFMLAAESPVFEKMFESNFKELKEGKVAIPDFKKEVVQAGMDYCYRQDITEFLKDHENTMDLLRFCDKYDFQTLKPKLEKEIAYNLSKENVFYIASKAEEANAAHLRQACIDFIRPLLNNTVSWPNLDMSQIDATLFKDIVSGALNMNISE